jgi:hypothetical protein
MVREVCSVFVKNERLYRFYFDKRAYLDNSENIYQTT